MDDEGTTNVQKSLPSSERLVFESSVGEKTIRLYESAGNNKECYAEGVHGFIATQNGVKFNLYTTSFSDDDDEERREVVSRIVMSTSDFLRLAIFFEKRKDDILSKSIQLSQGDVEDLLKRDSGKEQSEE